MITCRYIVCPELLVYQIVQSRVRTRLDLVNSLDRMSTCDCICMSYQHTESFIPYMQKIDIVYCQWSCWLALDRSYADIIEWSVLHMSISVIHAEFLLFSTKPDTIAFIIVVNVDESSGFTWVCKAIRGCSSCSSWEGVSSASTMSENRAALPPTPKK